MTIQRFEFLLQKYKEQSLGEGEWQELMQAVDQEKFNDLLGVEILTDLRARRTSAVWTADREQAVWNKINPFQTQPEEAPLTIASVRNIRWAWSWAAAIIFLLCGGASYFFFVRKSKSEIAQTPTNQSIKNDIAPGTNKATLILAGGSKILLDSAQTGELAKLGTTKVIKTDSGKLIYTAGDKEDGEAVGLNVLNTPRGGQYQLTLPDGTNAWLNAASSISYPTRFTGSQRSISITGEVYFEVAKDAAHPFVVSLKQGEENPWMQVEVLGTHFNINSYTDEEHAPAKTTLLEGSVKISAHGRNQIIKPGEQAAASLSGENIRLTSNMDLEKVMAWKNGKMALSDVSVKRLMQEISRWYDVDIEYRGAVPDKKFIGTVNRNAMLSSVLKVLKAYGIETRLEGKLVIVL